MKNYTVIVLDLTKLKGAANHAIFNHVKEELIKKKFKDVQQVRLGETFYCTSECDFYFNNFYSNRHEAVLYYAKTPTSKIFDHNQIEEFIQACEELFKIKEIQMEIEGIPYVITKDKIDGDYSVFMERVHAQALKVQEEKFGKNS